MADLPAGYVPDEQRFTFSGRGDVFRSVDVWENDDATGAAMASFRFPEGTDDLTSAEGGTHRMRLTGNFRWVTTEKGEPAIALDHESPRGRMTMIGSSELIEGFAKLQSRAQDFATAFNHGDTSRSDQPLVIRTIALAWLLTDEEPYREALFHAADAILATSPDSVDDMVGSAIADSIGVIYDTLHKDVGTRTHAPSGTTYRVAIAEFVKASLRHWASYICGGEFDSQWKCPAGETIYVSGSHAPNNSGKFGSAVLALVDDFPELENVAVRLLANLKAVQAFRDYALADGGHYFGFAYGAGYSELRSTMIWHTATDANVLWPYMANLPLHYIYGLRADHDFPAVGDRHAQNIDWADEYVLQSLVASTRFQNQYAEAFFRTHQRGVDNGFYELVFWNPDASRTPVATLPLVRHFISTGEVIARESWYFETSALFEFRATPYYVGNHQHHDNGAFSLYYRAPLLVDSGRYDLYGTEHWHNYYRRTIAHNAMVLYDPEEKYVSYSKKRSNDGGQRWTREYPTLEQVQPGQQAARMGINAYEHTEKYTYFRADMSDSYESTKLEQQRGWV